MSMKHQQMTRKSDSDLKINKIGGFMFVADDSLFSDHGFKKFNFAVHLFTNHLAALCVQFSNEKQCI